LAQCVLSILNNTPSSSFEIVVVDNASHDGSSQYIRENFELVRLIVNDSNLGFSRGNNIGIQATKGKYVLLLNSDTIVMQGALDVLVDYLDARGDVAAVGPMLLNRDLTVQRSWFDFPSVAKTLSHILGLSRLIYKAAGYKYVSQVLSYLGFEPAFMRRDFNEPARIDYLIFACVLVRRTLFEEIGLLDEGLFFYHEDYEFGYRMFANGLRIHYLPNAKIIHLGGGTSTRYLLKTYRENFRGIFYVYGKYHGAAKNITLRVSVALGFVVRSVFWFLGGYRRVKNLVSILKINELRSQTNPSL
jgi:GT2 family glycosyltransferase